MAVKALAVELERPDEIPAGLFNSRVAVKKS